MSVLKILKKYVIDSQIYVSLMGTALAVFFLLEQNTFRFPLMYLIFLTFFSGYLYTKYQGHRDYFKKILFFNAITGIICVLLILRNHNYYVLLRWLMIVFLGMLYNSFFLDYFVRKIPLFKVFYVGIVWGLMTAFLGFKDFHYSIFWITFFYITALVLPFDIRDSKKDDVLTFPKLIGKQKTKYIAYLLIFIANIIAVLYLQPTFALALYLSSLVSYVFIYFSEEEKSDIYFSFGVETCCGLALVFYFVLYFL